MRFGYFIHHFIIAIQKRLFPSRRVNSFTGVAYVEPHADPAKELKARKLVLINTSGKNKWIKFLCPCGCGDIQALNLMQSQRPCWVVTSHKDGTLSVSPSVDAQKCGAHFWVRHNQIHWC